MKNGNDRKQEHEQLPPCDIPPEYYDFSSYVSKERILTYWHQVDEITRRKPRKVLEIGKGNGIVAAMLSCCGIESVTADINESLKPDIVASITELDSHFSEGQYPFVLCARVLQHLPFSDFDKALSQLRHVTSEYVLLTLPVETMRLYFRFRVTGTRPTTLSIPLPLFFKRILQSTMKLTQSSKKQNFWKINQTRQTSLSNVIRTIGNHFHLEKFYRVPEDMSHAFFVLRKK